MSPTASLDDYLIVSDSDSLLYLTELGGIKIAVSASLDQSIDLRGARAALRALSVYELEQLGLRDMFYPFGIGGFCLGPCVGRGAAIATAR